MEPGIKEFFRRLSLSIGLCIVWMAINIVIGVKLGYAFFEDKIQIGNIVFYIWVAISFIGLLWLCIRIWENPIEHLDD
jgi:ABC-type glycerol-3-phosphate transport system permease component